MPNNLTDLDVNEISLVDRPANSDTDPRSGLKTPRAIVALFKRDAVAKGVKYLVSGKDGDHLPYTGPDGKPDHKLMGAAWAALYSNHRGQPYAGPDKEGAKARLRRIYEQEGLDTPAQKGETMPFTLEQLEAKVLKMEPELAAVKDENAILKAENEVVLKMSKKERKAYSAMSAEKRKEYMAADTEKRKSMMDAACKDMDGDDDEDEKQKASKAAIQKMVADQVSVIKAEFTAEIKKLNEENAAANLRAETLRFEALAETELPNSPGTREAKGARLMKAAKAMGGEQSEDFKAHMETLKKADAALLNGHFAEVTKWGGGGEEAGSTLEQVAEKIAKRDNITKEQAYIVASEERPELFDDYNAVASVEAQRQAQARARSAGRRVA